MFEEGLDTTGQGVGAAPTNGLLTRVMEAEQIEDLIECRVQFLVHF